MSELFRALLRMFARNNGMNPPDEKPDYIIDERSEKNIRTLHLKVQTLARKLMELANDHGIKIKVISGTRTYQEQDILFAQGRTKSGHIVTRAQGGYSNHNFRIAFDIGIFTKDGGYIPETKLYSEVGKLGKSIGLEWGGDWKTIEDQPHFQLRPKWATNIPEKAMLSEFRRRTVTGIDLFE